jgi:hypothetical protein
LPVGYDLVVNTRTADIEFWIERKDADSVVTLLTELIPRAST